MVYVKCEGNPWGVSTCISDSRYRKEETKESSEKVYAERRKISLLKDVEIRKQFEEKVIKLVDVRAPNMCGHYKDGI